MVVSRISAAVRARAPHDRSEFMFPRGIFDIDAFRLSPPALPMTVANTTINELQPYIYTTTEETVEYEMELLVTGIRLDLPFGMRYRRPPRWAWRRGQDPLSYVNHTASWQMAVPADDYNDFEALPPEPRSNSVDTHSE